MGKTAAGAVWLNEAQFSAYDFWQYWRNTEDGDVSRFLKLFTILPLAEIEKLSAMQGAEINEAKKILATETTALLHGRAKADAAAATAQTTFEHGGAGGDLPTIEIPRSDIDNELSIIAAFISAGLVKSNGEAKRNIQGGALRINDATITDEKAKLTPKDINKDGIIKLSLGKKKHVLLKPV
jgi:tyrosyl-tRNA synthetase